MAKPSKGMSYVRTGLGLNGAAKAAGYTEDENLKQGKGLISLLTKGRINRKDYIRQAVDMALIDAYQHIKLPR